MRGSNTLNAKETSEHREVRRLQTDLMYWGDARDLLRAMPSKSVQLVVTSPPYNIGKDYETRVSLDEYLAQQTEVISELNRVLADSGSICWQVGSFISRGEVVPLDIPFYPLFTKHGLKLRNRIVWHFGHGLHATKRFSGRYETILWFTRTDQYTFNLDSVRVPSKYPGKRHYKGPKKGQPSGNPEGKNPSDVWEVLRADWESLVWDIPNVKANHPEKTIQPCQFPVELVERCVLALTNPGDVVLDPYAGVGSTLLAAIKHQRVGVGSEKERKYHRIAVQRIGELHRGKLRTRDLGRPVFVPSATSKVATMPLEWLRDLEAAE